MPVQSCAGEGALGGRPPGVRETPTSGGDPLPPEGVPRALCPGEGAVLPAAAPWPTAGHPSAWEFLKLGPAGAGRAQELGAEADGGVSACDKCVSRGSKGWDFRRVGGGRGPGLRLWDMVLGFRAGVKAKGQDVAAAFIPVGCWQSPENSLGLSSVLCRRSLGTKSCFQPWVLQYA